MAACGPMGGRRISRRQSNNITPAANNNESIQIGEQANTVSEIKRIPARKPNPAPTKIAEFPINLQGTTLADTPKSVSLDVALYVTMAENKMIYITLTGKPYIPPMHYLALDNFLEEHNRGDATLSVKRYGEMVWCQLGFTPATSVKWIVTDLVRDLKSIVNEIVRENPTWTFRIDEMEIFNRPRDVLFHKHNGNYTDSCDQASIVSRFESRYDAMTHFKAMKLFVLYYAKTAELNMDTLPTTAKKDKFIVQLNMRSTYRGMSGIKAEGYQRLIDETYQLRYLYRANTSTYYTMTFSLNPVKEYSYNNLRMADHRTATLEVVGNMYFNPDMVDFYE